MVKGKCKHVLKSVFNVGETSSLGVLVFSIIKKFEFVNYM